MPTPLPPGTAVLDLPTVLAAPHELPTLYNSLPMPWEAHPVAAVQGATRFERVKVQQGLRKTRLGAAVLTVVPALVASLIMLLVVRGSAPVSNVTVPPAAEPLMVAPPPAAAVPRRPAAVKVLRSKVKTAPARPANVEEHDCVASRR
jgi:hypothetical protein